MPQQLQVPNIDPDVENPHNAHRYDREVSGDLEHANPTTHEKLKHIFSRFLSNIPELGEEFWKSENTQVMEYHTRDLAGWQAYRFVLGTCFQNIKLLWLVARLFLMSFVVAFSLLYLGSYYFKPAFIFHLQLGTLSRTMNFFIGTMLAFFLGSSVGRWVDAIGGCLMLFDSIRNLNMQFLALGVSNSQSKKVMRYGLLSCEFLALELHMRAFSKEERRTLAASTIEGADYGHLEAWERDVLEDIFVEHHRVAAQIWIWIASLIGRMAQDGDVPPMASPTYGRIMNLAQYAQEGIRQVRISMTVQMPFIYVHTLAFLVHMNNICCAVDFGAYLARMIAGILWFNNIHFMQSDLLAEPVKHESLHHCVESIAVQMVTSMFPAIMYQAVLQIGLILAQPFDQSFGSGISVIPTRQLTNQLKSDLKCAEKMAASVKAWDKPCFKQSTK